MRPRTIRDIQRLNGRIIAFSRFLSKSVAKSLPFLKVLRGAVNKTDPQARKEIQWVNNYEKVFQKLKEYLKMAPLLSQPPEGVLVMYLAIDEEVLATVLVRTGDKQQYPVYYVSKVLKGAELNYKRIEKATCYGGDHSKIASFTSKLTQSRS